MEPERLCLRCGQIIPWGSKECPFCSVPRGYLWMLRRDTYLFAAIVLLIILFVITGISVKHFHAMEKNLAQDWYAHGEQVLQSGDAGTALEDFRNAVAYSRDNPLYQLKLAQALAATGRRQEARTYLMSLRDRDPGNGLVNLELARLAVRDHAVTEAVQYFHDAVYSEWNGDPVVKRRAVRLELINFLLDSDQKAAARAELIAVAGNLPPSAELQDQVASELVKTGGYDDALRLFLQALATEPNSAPALAGAGECYFQTGQYTAAELYLDRALQRDPNLIQAAAMRDTARAVLSLDPFTRGLGEEERARRANRAFHQATLRLAACAAQRGIELNIAGDSPLQRLYVETMGAQPRVRESTLRRDPEFLYSIMDLAFRIEKSTAQSCGEPQGSDLALLLIAQQQEGRRP